MRRAGRKQIGHTNFQSKCIFWIQAVLKISNLTIRIFPPHAVSWNLFHLDLSHSGFPRHQFVLPFLLVCKSMVCQEDDGECSCLSRSLLSIALLLLSCHKYCTSVLLVLHRSHSIVWSRGDSSQCWLFSTVEVQSSCQSTELMQVTAAQSIRTGKAFCL